MSIAHLNSDSDKEEMKQKVPTEIVAKDDAKAEPKSYYGRVKWFNMRRGFGFITPLEFEDLKEEPFVFQVCFRFQFWFQVFGKIRL